MARDDFLGEDERGGMYVDLSTIRAYMDALEELERRWAEVPAGTRAQLSRIVWLHPNGEVIPYTTPDSDYRARGLDPDPPRRGGTREPGEGPDDGPLGA